jgi:hypothetical protein
MNSRLIGKWDKIQVLILCDTLVLGGALGIREMTGVELNWPGLD